MQDYKPTYDAWHQTLPVDYAADTPWHRMIKEAIAGSDLSGRRVLEIGCGRGGFACWLARTWPDSALTAADFSESAISKAKAFAKTEGLLNIHWRVADIQNMPWPESSFDTVISCETIEHVPAPRQALIELARVLCAGGTLFLTFPNYFSASGLHRIYRRVVRGEHYSEEGQPINQFTMVPQVRSWLGDAGLDVRLVRSVNHSIPVPGRPGVVIRSLERAPFPFPWLGSNALIIALKPRATESR